MKTMISVLFAGLTTMGFAAPKLTGVVMSQPKIGVVQVDYELGNEPAIVTADFLTNGVSIGERNFTRLKGDVNCKVGTGPHSFTWRARKDWPDRNVKMTVKVRAWRLSCPPDYMVVDLAGEARGKVSYYVSTDALPENGLANDMYRLGKLVLRKIPARGVTWCMGSSAVEGGVEHEAPHMVTLTHDYFMAIYPTTQQQYMYIMDTPVNGSTFLHDQYGSDDNLMGPVETTSYNAFRGGNWPTGDRQPAADSMIADLRNLTQNSGFDLPTEARWEYACRAGTVTIRPWGDGISTDLANYGNSVKSVVETKGMKFRTSRVDAYRPNAWGIYDMLGNIEELCLDWYEDKSSASVPRQAAVDPVGPESGADGKKVTRGGYAASPERDVRSAWRNAGATVGQSRAVMGARICCEVGE